MVFWMFFFVGEIFHGVHAYHRVFFFFVSGLLDDGATDR